MACSDDWVDVSPDIDDFGYFKVKLSGELTLGNSLATATVLGYPPADIDEMRRSNEVGHLFVTKMESRGHISNSNIKPLTDALTKLGFDGIRTKVESLFVTVRKITPQEEDEGSNISSDEEEDDSYKPMTIHQKRYLDRLCSELRAEGTDWKSYSKDLRGKGALTPTEYKRVKKYDDNLGELFAVLKEKPSWVAKILTKQSVEAINEDILAELRKRTTMKIPDDVFEEIKMQSTKTFNVVLIGKTGSGKSSTGNSILGKNEFEMSKNCWSSCSRHVEMKETVEKNVTLKVMDTPGLFDTDSKRGNSDVYLEFTKMALQFPEGVHVFLIVCRDDSPFTPEEKATILGIERHFGRTFFRRSMLVFTRGDALSAGENLAKSMDEAPEELKTLYRNVSKRALAIDNKPSGPNGGVMLRMQRLWLISAIVKLASEGKPYREEIFGVVNRIISREGDTLERLLKTTLVIYSHLRDDVIARSNEKALRAMLEEERLPDQDLKSLREVPEIASEIKSLEDKHVTLGEVVCNGLSRYRAEIVLTLNVSGEFRMRINEVVREHINKVSKRGVNRLSKELCKNNVPSDLVDKVYDTKSERAHTAMTRDELKMVIRTVITSNLNIIEEVMEDYWNDAPMCSKFLTSIW